MATILDGKLVSGLEIAKLAKETAEMVKMGWRPPHLSAVLVGDNPASQVYVNSKIKSCEKAGFRSSVVRFDAQVSENELLKAIDKLNNDPETDGFIVQLPLPPHISESKVTMEIDPEKDVDGFHPVNLGKMMLGLPSYIPATPFGIMKLLEHYRVETSGKHCVIIGRSNIVGTPMAVLMSRNNAFANCTVTLCHSKTKNIPDFTRNADIVIAAIGKPRFLKGNMIKEGAVIVDVGINRISDTGTKSGYRLVGDVDYEEVLPLSSFITPVPGGVGLMTIAGLLGNTMLSAKKRAI